MTTIGDFSFRPVHTVSVEKNINAYVIWKCMHLVYFKTSVIRSESQNIFFLIEKMIK